MVPEPSKPKLWPTTHWSLVGRLGSAGIEERRQALTALVRTYLPVLRRHLLFRRKIHHNQVDDLLQEFLLSKVVEKGILQLARRERGRFRTFLATALDRFVFNQIRNQKAAKRAASQCSNPEDVEVDVDVAHSGNSPDIFDVFWARQVLGQAIRQMRTKCHKGNRPDIWGVFRGRILLPTLRSVAPVPFESLIEELRLGSKKKASNLLLTANRMFGRSLRSVIGTYDHGRTDIESEINDLRQALSRIK